MCLTHGILSKVDCFLFCHIGNGNRPGVAKGPPIMLFTEQDGLPEYASSHNTYAEIMTAIGI